jgi:hypothetical protein
MKQKLNDEFVKYYLHTVKPVAVKCADGYKTILAIENGQKFEDTHKDMVKIKTSLDVNAIWYIGLMIGDIESCILNGKSLNLVNSVCTVQGCLNSDSYWTNVWKDDFTSEEAKNLKELGGMMNDLISKM